MKGATQTKIIQIFYYLVIFIFIFTNPIAKAATKSNINSKGSLYLEMTPDVPFLITQYENSNFTNLYITIQNLGGNESKQYIEMGAKYIDNISDVQLCSQPMAAMLVHNYLKSATQFNNSLTAKVNERLTKRLTKQCPNFLLYTTLTSSKKHKITNAYRYIESQINAKTDLANIIEQKKYSNKEITKLAKHYYDNVTFKGLLQTYILLTLSKHQEKIADPKSLALSLIILADAYYEQGDEFKYRMVMWTIIPELERSGVIAQYTTQIGYHVYLR